MKNKEQKISHNIASLFVYYLPIKGEIGEQGDEGLAGIPGRDGADGIDGLDGRPGPNAYTPKFYLQGQAGLSGLP